MGAASTGTGGNSAHHPYGKVKALKENAALFNFLQENVISSMQELYAKVIAMLP
ncbi:MAG: hypothetical protein PHR21_03245 [Oscillospiraceae bacterium]|nr:hypothetical protein [Oscillospiraceae bacterium]MDD4368136.1 hypothetical protein [Oscillospiraceae bacterium]